MIPQRISSAVALGLSVALLAVPVSFVLVRPAQSAAPEAPAPATPAAKAAPPAARPAAEEPARFDPQQIVALAQRLAAAPPRARPVVTPGLEQLNYDQYRQIRFRIDQALWTKDRSPFRVDLLPAGFVYTAPVSIAIVENGFARELVSQPNMFDFGPAVPARLRSVPLSLSGFRVRTRINTRAYWDEFLVFQGASYFRAVGRGQNYGLSARGLALRTAEPEGEEFPSFTQFWIEKPAPNATSFVVHALLESPSVTGAYRFETHPGSETAMDVSFTLFPRVDLRNVGIAPLTSMFLFDGTNRQAFDDFRFRVHDSDGLLMINNNGEQVWRHLANPRQLQLSSFTTERPRGFGLMQRARLLSDYQDLEANYERRPSAWVEFKGATQPGPLRLVEIPTRRETNDNIVAFWQPRDVLPAGKPYSGEYRLSWTAESLVPQVLGKVVASRMGTNFEGDRKLVALDLTGIGSSPDGLKLDVVLSTGKFANPVIQPNPTIRGLRASFEFDPGGAQLVEMRVVVRKGTAPASETWLYRWTAS